MIRVINYVISAIFFICYSYQLLYLFVPLFIRKKRPVDVKLRRYAVLISARNEERVIGQLISSINAQSYPEDLITVFVCADNCSDNTALEAERHGANVYERENPRKIGKGYALDWLLKQIDRDFGIGSFDGFFVFDADNILEPDYIYEMNRTFGEGNRIVTGYRNSKNYGDNWISAGYSLWFLRESQYLNRPRYLLGTSCSVSGTGFLFSREIIERSGGWRYYLLTEDIEFTVENIIRGEKIAYCESAVLYDEQPTDFKQSVRQRLRWAKGYYQVFTSYGGELIKGIFSKNFFSCFDMTMAILPAMILSFASIVSNFAAIFADLGSADVILRVAASFGQSALNIYLTFLLLGGITLLSEWTSIHAPSGKKLLYLITFPIFMFTYIPISAAAMFIDVQWKPIVHERPKTLSDVHNRR